MTVNQTSGKTPEDVFAEFKAAAHARDWKTFYGCMTVAARKNQIQTMLLDLGRGAHVAKNGAEEPAGELYDMKATPQTCLFVCKKHQLPNGELQIDELGPVDFDLLVSDSWHALQNRERPYVEDDASLTKVTVDGDSATGTVLNAFNRHDERNLNIYFEQVDGRWLIDITPWWSPWGPPPEIRFNPNWKRE